MFFTVDNLNKMFNYRDVGNNKIGVKNVFYPYSILDLNRDPHRGENRILLISTQPYTFNRYETKNGVPVVQPVNNGIFAYGEYDTLDEAIEMLEAEFSGLREVDVRENSRGDENAVAAFLPGSLIKWSEEWSEEWSAEVIREKINANSTDEEIKQLFNELRAEASIPEIDTDYQGAELHECVLDRMFEYRDELQDEE